MSWVRWFYWCFRYTMAVPVAVLATLALVGLMLFEALFGVPEDADVLDAGDLMECYRLLFTAKLER